MDTQKITILGMNIKTFVILMFILIIVLIFALLFQANRISIMNKKYSALMSGKKGADLEKIIRIRFKEMDKVKANARRVTREHKQIQKDLSHCISRYGLIKYDAFEEMAGKLSFVIALLDENNNGIVFNSMHSREGCFTYAKEIIDGKSYIPLSKEELQAIEQAKTIDDEIDALTAQADSEDFMNYVDTPKSRTKRKSRHNKKSDVLDYNNNIDINNDSDYSNNIDMNNNSDYSNNIDMNNNSDYSNNIDINNYSDYSNPDSDYNMEYSNNTDYNQDDEIAMTEEQYRELYRQQIREQYNNQLYKDHNRIT